MENKKVIQVKDLTKMYKLYDKPSDRLKEALGLTRKKLYKEHYALHDVNFDIYEGECVGIIGTNGSGKSTILKIITGVLTPTAGEVKVDGRISALLELGAGFNMEYSGLENVYLNGTMIGFSKEEIDARLNDILEFADIGDFIHQPYHKFEEFKKQGKTILFVSHDLGSVSKYCDRVILLNKGVKMDEGSPKQMVDLYKQLLVGQNPVKQNESDSTEQIVAEDSEGLGDFQVNPNMLEYGSRIAEITDFRVIDDKGRCSNTVEKGSCFKIRMKVRFNEEIQEPIMAYTFKNIQGTEITGTNTMYENAKIEHSGKGDICTVTFTQNMNLQGGEYLLSFGCTGYKNGDFTVFHRLYDACNITVISSKNTVGFYDMDSKVEVRCEEQV